jgi:hypothetical protein
VQADCKLECLRSLVLIAARTQDLGGEADRVELLGVDRWLGGTHVTPKTWRWDPNARLVYAVS